MRTRKQLDLVAAGLFAKFPKINKVKSALIFTVSKEFVQATHYQRNDAKVPRTASEGCCKD
jgi:hypothetical protein